LHRLAWIDALQSGAVGVGKGDLGRRTVLDDVVVDRTLGTGAGLVGAGIAVVV
jgi:hypothetical protein